MDSMLVMSGGEGYIDFRLGKSSPDFLLVMSGNQGNIDLLDVLIHASHVHAKAVCRIRDILVWILGSVPLTNGSGLDVTLHCRPVMTNVLLLLGTPFFESY